MDWCVHVGYRVCVADRRRDTTGTFTHLSGSLSSEEEEGKDKEEYSSTRQGSIRERFQGLSPLKIHTYSTITR
jgi:hypothetical protein